MFGDHQALATFTISVKREVETPIALLLPHETTARVSEEACQAGNGKQYVSSDGYRLPIEASTEEYNKAGIKKPSTLRTTVLGLLFLICPKSHNDYLGLQLNQQYGRPFIYSHTQQEARSCDWG